MKSLIRRDPIRQYLPWIVYEHRRITAFQTWEEAIAYALRRRELE